MTPVDPAGGGSAVVGSETNRARFRQIESRFATARAPVLRGISRAQGPRGEAAV